MSESMLPQLERVLCMLPSFAAASCVNKTWRDAVHTLKHDWAVNLCIKALDVPPNVTPSPRMCARILGFDIEEKFLSPFMAPIIHELDSSDGSDDEDEYVGYVPTSPSYDPTDPFDPTSPPYDPTDAAYLYLEM